MDTIKPPPLELRALSSWLMWKYEQKPGDKKPRKKPYYANNSARKGEQGSPEDVSKLVTYDEAVAAAKKHGMTGVGIAMLKGNGVTALDFDNCIDSNGNINKEVLSLIKDTYSEISPSGNGVRAFVKGELGNMKSRTTEDNFGFELFTNTGFVTYTSNCINDVGIATPADNVLDFIAKRFGKNAEKPFDNTHKPRLAVDKQQIIDGLKHLPIDFAYDSWVKVGMALHHQFEGSQEGFEIWDDWSARNTDKYSGTDYNKSKWDSFKTSRNGNIVTLHTLSRMIEEYGGHRLEEITNIVFKKFKVETLSDFISNISPVQWFIKDFLPRADFGVIYGESGAGKSFVALDICMSLATGKRWNNLEVITKPQKILYLAAEGQAAFRIRTRGYCEHYNVDIFDTGIEFIADCPSLLSKTDVSNLIQSIGKYDIVIIDTFAQVTAGANENSAEDMGKALNACKEVAKASEAMVLVVHHSGKDASKGVRGWSGLHAASDVVVSVEKDSDKRAIRVIKQKDGEVGRSFGFKLAPVDFKVNDIEYSSMIVEYGDEFKPEANKNERQKLKERQQDVYDLFIEHELTGWVTVSQLEVLFKDKCIENDKTYRKSNLEGALKTMTGGWLEGKGKPVKEIYPEYRLIVIDKETT